MESKRIVLGWSCILLTITGIVLHVVYWPLPIYPSLFFLIVVFGFALMTTQVTILSELEKLKKLIHEKTQKPKMSKEFKEMADKLKSSKTKTTKHSNGMWHIEDPTCTHDWKKLNQYMEECKICGDRRRLLYVRSP